MTYGYDVLGDLTQVHVNGVLEEDNTYGVLVNNVVTKPHAIRVHQQGQTQTTYSYDARGRQYAGGGRSITYTNFDLPWSITTSAGTTAFRYSAGGTRVRKFGPSGDVTVYVGGMYERRLDAKGVKHVFYVQGGDGPVAQVEVDGATLDRKTRYLTKDGLGSTGLVTDDSGVEVERLYFEPFGRRVEKDGGPASLVPNASGVTRGFTGHEHDDELGLINMRGRMYDPGLRRFLTPDPLVSAPLFGQSYNRYSYVVNSPLNLVDASGFDWWGGYENGDNSVCLFIICISFGDGGGGAGGSSGGQSGHMNPGSQAPTRNHGVQSGVAPPSGAPNYGYHPPAYDWTGGAPQAPQTPPPPKVVSSDASGWHGGMGGAPVSDADLTLLREMFSKESQERYFREQHKQSIGMVGHFWDLWTQAEWSWYAGNYVDAFWDSAEAALQAPLVGLAAFIEGLNASPAPHTQVAILPAVPKLEGLAGLEGAGGLAAGVRWKGFSKGSLATHFEKHGAEFGNITQSQYLNQAKSFAAENSGAFREGQIGNFIVKYDPATGRTLVGHAGSREIRTFYKADNRSADPFQKAMDLARNLSGL